MTLFEGPSPNGNLWALVEQEHDTCYFYLHPDPSTNLRLRSCWVRNLSPAPGQVDVSAMREGQPSMLPRENCRHPDGMPPPQESDLSVIWSLEGDAAALCEKGEIIAIVPSWSGTHGFHGFARDCIGTSDLCWELGSTETNVQIRRYQEAKAYWDSWSVEEGPWPKFQSESREAIEKSTAPHSNYYAIDGGHWPPKAILRIPCQDRVLLITIGMAIRPQPGVELLFDEPALHRRVELATLVHASSDEAIRKVASYISGQTDLPWARYTFLGHGHTLPSDVFGELSGGRMPFALLVSQIDKTPRISLPTYQGDPITLLWMIPISQKEQSFAESSGSTALLAKLTAAGIGDTNWLSREEVV